MPKLTANIIPDTKTIYVRIKKKKNSVFGGSIKCTRIKNNEMLTTEKDEIRQLDIVRNHWLEIEKEKYFIAFILLGESI